MLSDLVESVVKRNLHQRINEGRAFDSAEGVWYGCRSCVSSRAYFCVRGGMEGRFRAPGMNEMDFPRRAQPE
jgi:hypothetical protein